MSVELRMIRPEDVPVLLAWRNAPEVGRWMYSPTHTPESFAKYYVAETEGHSARAVWGDDRLIGFTHVYTTDDHRKVWGDYLDPSQVGKGYGRGLQSAAHDWMFLTLCLTEVWVEVYYSNRKVWQMRKRFGYRVVDLWPDHRSKDGEVGDVVLMSLSAGRWCDLHSIKTTGDWMRAQADVMAAHNFREGGLSELKHTGAA